jgi:hypothetical protein
MTDKASQRLSEVSVASTSTERQKEYPAFRLQFQKPDTFPATITRCSY